MKGNNLHMHKRAKEGLHFVCIALGLGIVTYGLQQLHPGLAPIFAGLLLTGVGVMGFARMEE